MLRTIQWSSTVFVQGMFVRVLEDGRVAVQVGDQIFAGQPVSQKAA